jgi:alpha-mannosidase
VAQAWSVSSAPGLVIGIVSGTHEVRAEWPQRGCPPEAVGKRAGRTRPACDDMAMRIASVTATELFAAAPRPLQVIRVSLLSDTPGTAPGPGPATFVRIEGPGVSTPEPAMLAGWAAGQEATAEVGIAVAAPAGPGSVRQVTVIAESGGPRAVAARAEARAEITIAEPGWTMWMVSHFHYDPVWWATQGQFTQSRLLLPDADGRLPDVRTAFDLVRLHLDAARADPDYKFVLAEIDYLKPFFDAHPEDREDLLDLIRQGRVEIVGGSYNEPNTNLTSAESTVRNALLGLAFQREVLGADPSVAWMLDAFGFDPSYPSLIESAGLAESAWARGPHHQWGPNRTVGDNRRMQFASEFEWLAPDGHGLLTSYMPNHYGAGWVTQAATSLAEAEQAALRQFRQLAPVAATRNVLLPVGADHVIPSRWATSIHRDWNSRYAWPRFVTALPSEFFAAVRKEAADAGIWLTPQTRDMNPVYPGKDVSYIDTKQAHRAAEVAVADGEALATLAWLAGAAYPARSLDRAWRLLAFAAHHDAITGTESDQVYLDLLAGWREAYERGDRARRDAAAYLAGLACTASLAGTAAPADALVIAVVVVNTLPRRRCAMVTVTLEPPRAAMTWMQLRDDAGRPIPFLAGEARRHGDGSLARLTVTFRAADVPSLGYRSYLLVPAAAPAQAADAGWQPADGHVIRNELFRVEADPAAGGTLRITSTQTGADLLAGPGNELVLQEEYDYHPRWGEGPWLLSPKGPGTGSASRRARVRAERCPVGSRLVTSLTIGDLRVTQETLLWHGAERVEFRTHVDGSIGRDRLLRVRFPTSVRGGLPVYQTAAAVIGRTPGEAGADVAEHEFTMDCPAYQWFAVGSTARVAVTSRRGRRLRAIGVAEVIPPGSAFRPGMTGTSVQNGLRSVIRDLMAALAGAGITGTCSRPDGPRYGSVDVDSNLPDVRIALGGPDQNEFTAAVLAAAGSSGTAPAFGDPAALLAARLAGQGTARVWVPGRVPRREALRPGADLRGPLDLPVLVVAGGDLAGAVRDLISDLDDATIEVAAADGADGGPSVTEEEDLARHTVAVLNRGTPGCLVTPDGVMYLSLMRSCSAWPSGVWIDGERRTAPDGSSFAWQHWSHTFEYALAAGGGDWRSAGFQAAGQDYNHELLACVTGLHDGPLPASASLAGIEPEGPALLALKPAGNSLHAVPGPVPSEPGADVAVRLAAGGQPDRRPTRVRLFTGIASARLTDAAEKAGGAPLPVRDGTCELDVADRAAVTAIVTTRPWPASRARPAASGAAAPEVSSAPGPGAPAAMPVFARYWLHGTGPAPAGNMPVAVHLSPARLALDADRPGGTGDPRSPGSPDDAGPAAGRLRLTVACGPEPAAGAVEVLLPAPLRVAVADPAGPAGPAGPARATAPIRYDLGSRGHAAWDLTVTAPPGTPSGRYFATARIISPGGQPVEDAVLVTVGEPGEPALDLPLAELLPLLAAGEQATAAEIAVALEPARLELCPGQAATLRVRVSSALRSELRGEVTMLSPFGSWNDRQWTAPLTAGPGQTVTLSFPVTVPASARPGQQWWALAKVMYFGRVRYTVPTDIVVVG